MTLEELKKQYPNKTLVWYRRMLNVLSAKIFSIWTDASKVFSRRK